MGELIKAVRFVVDRHRHIAKVDPWPKKRQRFAADLWFVLTKPSIRKIMAEDD
jgi:hypothetical protein